MATVTLSALEDMQRASALVDAAADPADYQIRLVALALIAREFLRQADLPSIPSAKPVDYAIGAVGERLLLNAYGRQCYDAGRRAVLAPTDVLDPRPEMKVALDEGKMAVWNSNSPECHDPK